MKKIINPLVTLAILTTSVIASTATTKTKEEPVSMTHSILYGGCTEGQTGVVKSSQVTANEFYVEVECYNIVCLVQKEADLTISAFTDTWRVILSANGRYLNPNNGTFERNDPHGQSYIDHIKGQSNMESKVKEMVSWGVCKSWKKISPRFWGDDL